MTLSEYINILSKIEREEGGDLEVCCTSIISPDGVRFASPPDTRHLRQRSEATPPGEKVRGCWSPRFHRPEEKGKLVLWLY